MLFFSDAGLSDIGWTYFLLLFVLRRRQDFLRFYFCLLNLIAWRVFNLLFNCCNCIIVINKSEKNEKHKFSKLIFGYSLIILEEKKKLSHLPTSSIRDGFSISSLKCLGSYGHDASCMADATAAIHRTGHCRHNLFKT